MKLIRNHYLDACAIVKLFVDEEGSTALRTYFESESGFYATSLCFSEALGVLKVKHFYRKEITDEQYFSACDELLSYAGDDTIEIEDVPIKDITNKSFCGAAPTQKLLFVIWIGFGATHLIRLKSHALF